MAAAVYRMAALALACAACTTVSVNQSTFEGTHWRVAAVNGRPTPAEGTFDVQFEGGRISGSFGCNRWTGGYAVAGETLTATQVAVTRMACVEPFQSLEDQGIAVLNQPMRWTWIGAQQLRLFNGAGTITLQRQRSPAHGR